jgi:hypothetical protein
MTSHELPSSGTGGESPNLTEPLLQEHDPLFTLTQGDVQTVAQKQLGRELTDAEIKAVIDIFSNTLDLKFYLENSIHAGQEEGKVGPAVAGYQREEDKIPEHTIQPVAAVTTTPEQSERIWFFVDYSLSSRMPVQATAEHEAGEQAFATLHGLVGQADFLGVTPRLAEQVRLGEAEIMIDDVEVAPPEQDILQTPSGFFEITSVSRGDLESCGFDAGKVSDADMELLASKMADDYGRQLFWSSLTLIAETLGFPRQVPSGLSEFPPEHLDMRHSYAAYVFDNPDIRKHDVAAVIEEAGRLGYPVRYWWLSQAMDLGDRPERLIICVHHPVIGEHAGLDLYEKLKELQIEWDDLDAATVEEYLLLSRPITEKGIAWPDGRTLFPSDPSQEVGGGASGIVYP